MQYKQDKAQAQEIARLVFPLLTRLGIPMNPVNYALWYEYHLGRSEGLVSELDKVLSEEQPFEAERARELFLRYVATPGVEALERIEVEVCRLLADVVQIVIDAGLDLGKYGGLLQSCSVRLESSDDLRAIRTLVSTLKADTHEMANSSRRSAGALKERAEEIDVLRAELDRVRQESIRDPLTGLANRRAFDDRLAESLDDSLQQLQKICLLMIDIDRFKEINDKHGHQIGDKILQYIASVLKKNFKGKDLVARFGGDEFAVIVENAPIAGVQRVAESVREQINESTLKRTDTGEPLGTVTVSIGYDCLKPEDKPDDVLKRADKALYRAKQNGRNCVELYR